MAYIKNPPPMKPFFTFEDCKPMDDDAFCGLSVQHQVFGGGGGYYESNAIKIHVGKDGHLAFFDRDGDSFIYLYPEQVKHMNLAIKTAKLKGERHGDIKRKGKR